LKILSTFSANSKYDFASSMVGNVPTSLRPNSNLEFSLFPRIALANHESWEFAYYA
jgi:hypothetical protein